MSDKQPDDPGDHGFAAHEYPIPERIENPRVARNVERIALSVLILLVLVALTGVFSDGPLSSNVLTSANGRIVIDYERFERSGANSHLRIRLRGEPGESVKLHLGGDLLAAHDIESLQPQLSASESWHGGLGLQGRLDDRGELDLYLSLLPKQAGLLHERVAFAGDHLEFWQFVYP